MENLPYDEAYIWQAYQRKYGSLSIARRVDNVGGLLAYMQGRVSSETSTIADFMHQPIGEDAEDVGMDSVLQFFEVFGSLKNGD